MENLNFDKMIFIENTSNDPHYNLAFEEYVLKEVAKVKGDGPDGGIPILLLWQNEPSVIIGKYQNTIEEINYDFINENHINVVRRNTGGGAVYHDLGNLNYSFIIPDVESKVDFKTFTIPLVKALNSQGIPAEQTGRNDILVDGKKFSGNAQQFTDHKLLHHGTIMFDVDTDAVANALKVKPGKFKSKASKSVRSRVTNLKPYFDKSQEAESSNLKTAQNLKELLIKWFGIEYELIERKLTDDQLAEIVKLKEQKYDTDDWNFGKSPKADISRGEHFRCGYVEFNFVIDKHKVKSLKLTGDFFASRNIEEFEDMFAGVDYTKEAILEVLNKTDLKSFLGDVTADELIEVIV